MPKSSTSEPTEEAIIAILGEMFYRVIPAAYTQYCVHVSRVAAEVLARFGVAARVLPCQLWHASRTNNHVMGFVGLDPKRGHWDGHVVCATDTNLFDAAVRALQLKSGQLLPAIAGAHIFDVPTHVIARLMLDGESALWWHDAPEGADLSLPPVSEPSVRNHVAALVPLIEQRLVSRQSAGVLGG